MEVAPSQTFADTWFLADATNTLSQADTTPTVTQYVDGVVVSTCSVVMTSTGIYVATGAAPNQAGKELVRVFTATLNGAKSLQRHTHSIVSTMSFDDVKAGIASAVAGAILINPGNKLTTNASGQVPVSNLPTVYPASGDWAKAGDAMALTTTARDALVVAVQAGIIDEADGQKVLEAFVTKLNATDVNLAGLSTASIAGAVWSFLLSNMATAGSAGKFFADLASGAVKLTTTVGGVDVLTINGQSASAAITAAVPTAAQNAAAAKSAIEQTNSPLLNARDSSATAAAQAANAATSAAAANTSAAAALAAINGKPTADQVATALNTSAPQVALQTAVTVAGNNAAAARTSADTAASAATNSLDIIGTIRRLLQSK